MISRHNDFYRALGDYLLDELRFEGFPAQSISVASYESGTVKIYVETPTKRIWYNGEPNPVTALAELIGKMPTQKNVHSE